MTDRATSHPDQDPEIAKALGTLPKPPEHRPAFWTDLETELMSESNAASSNERRDRRSATPRHSHRGRLLLVAASLVVVAGAVGFGLSNRTSNTIDASAPVLQTTTTAAQQTNPPAAVDDVPRAASNLYLYDVALPAGFSIDYATGRGVSLSHTRQPFDAYIQTSNYGPDGDWASFTEPYRDTEELMQETTLTVPLLDRTASGLLVDNGVILEVQQYQFQDGDRSRWVRTYVFADRVVVAELVSADPELLDRSPQELLDGIRMENAAFEPIQGCSSNGVSVVPPPAGLNDAQAETYSLILHALSDCDWTLLDELTDEGFTASFGGSDALVLWQDAESFGEPVLARLYEHLTVPFADTDGIAQWPRASAYLWEEVDDEMKAELTDLGYADLSAFEKIGYIGYRAGIDTDGNWLYFVAGD